MSAKRCTQTTLQIYAREHYSRIAPRCNKSHLVATHHELHWVAHKEENYDEDESESGPCVSLFTHSQPLPEENNAHSSGSTCPTERFRDLENVTQKQRSNLALPTQCTPADWFPSAWNRRDFYPLSFSGKRSAQKRSEPGIDIPQI